jgi:hypothetical protein
MRLLSFGKRYTFRFRCAQPTCPQLSTMASMLRAAQRAFSSRLPSSFTGIPLRLYSTEAKASDLKVGTFIEHESKFWQVHSITRSAQGAQRSVLIMTELKEFKNGRKDNVRFDQDDPISGMWVVPSFTHRPSPDSTISLNEFSECVTSHHYLVPHGSFSIVQSFDSIKPLPNFSTARVTRCT